jgi:hypothetical protein
MAQDTQSVSKSWWQTLPGLLTAVAGIITAVTGLLVAVHQAGWFNHASAPSASVQTTSPTSENTAQPGGTSAVQSTATSRSLTLPQTTQLRYETAVYQLLAARVEPYSPGKVALRLGVRMTNNNRYDANFWAASFRLSSNGALIAPNSDLDELVAANSSKDAEIEFILPDSLAAAGLQMGDVGDGKPSLPLTLQSVSR